MRPGQLLAKYHSDGGDNVSQSSVWLAHPVDLVGRIN
jgi:hypothetical protein